MHFANVVVRIVCKMHTEESLEVVPYTLENAGKLSKRMRQEVFEETANTAIAKFQAAREIADEALVQSWAVGADRKVRIGQLLDEGSDLMLDLIRASRKQSRVLLEKIDDPQTLDVDRPLNREERLSGCRTKKGCLREAMKSESRAEKLMREYNTTVEMIHMKYPDFPVQKIEQEKKERGYDALVKCKNAQINVGESKPVDAVEVANEAEELLS